jgi:fumarate reductase subunit C
MASTQIYTDYHPRWLRRPVSTYWWLEKGAYFAFILRESTCLFVAWFVVYLLLMIGAVAGGADRYRQFLTWSASPWMLTLNAASFLFIIYHAITFFVAAPQALVVRVGRRPVPARLVLVFHYIAWAASSALVAWVLLRT